MQHVEQRGARRRIGQAVEVDTLTAAAIWLPSFSV